MKQKRFSLLLITSLLLSVMAFCLPVTNNIHMFKILPESTFLPTAVVWSDNFNDLDISDWTYESGNFSVDAGNLRINGTNWHVAYHTSNVIYGTWSYDLLVTDTAEDHFVVWIVRDNTDGRVPTYGYMLHYEEDYDTLNLWEFTPSGHSTIGSYHSASIQGWNNYTITRGSDGYFVIYKENSPIIECLGTAVTFSLRFQFEGMANPIIDNIVVDNTITLDRVGPFLTDDPISDIIYGTDYRFDVNATDTSGIDTWHINNTAQFTIDSDGVITNTVPLSVGLYPLVLTVTDTIGNLRSKTFVLDVREPTVTPTPTPGTSPDLMTLALIGGGVVLAIVVIVVIVKKR